MLVPLPLCRTVAPEKCHEHEFAESTGGETCRKEQIQGLKVLATAQKRHPLLKECANNKETESTNQSPAPLLHDLLRAGMRTREGVLLERSWGADKALKDQMIPRFLYTPFSVIRKNAQGQASKNTVLPLDLGGGVSVQGTVLDRALPHCL